ncbi:MAG: methyltransferase domain-containing protein [Parvibaculum sp.]
MASLATLGSAELRKLSERELASELADMTPLAIDRFRRMRKLKPEHEEALTTFLRQNPEKRLTADGSAEQSKPIKAKTKSAGSPPKKKKAPRIQAENDGYVKLWMRMRAWWDGVDYDASPSRTPQKRPPKARFEITVDNAATLLEQRIEIIQELWGVGNSAPGGPEFVAELVRDSKPAAKARIADLSAGLGGGFRFLEATQSGTFAGFERDKDIAKAGHQISVDLNLAEKMPIVHFDPAHIDTLFEKNAFDLIVAREIFYSIADRRATLMNLADALDRNGSLVFTDFVLTDRASENKDVIAWRQTDPYKPTPSTIEEYRELLNELKYSVKSIDDISAPYVQAIQNGWKSIIDHLKTGEFSRSYVDTLMQEGQVWLARSKALQSGQLKLIKGRAVMLKAPKRSLNDSMVIDD